MNILFYTTLDNIEQLKNGLEISVWNENNAQNTDVHISLNIKEYVVRKTGTEGVFSVFPRN